MKFSEQLRITREKRKLSKAELAEKIFVSRSAIEDWENGKSEPDIETLTAIAKALNVSVDHLCSNYTETPFSSISSSPFSKGVRYLIIAVIAVAVFFGGFTIGSSFKATINNLKENIPDKVHASAVSFSFDGENVSYRFSPSVTGKNYSYKIAFTDYSGKVFEFDCVQKGGVCSGSVSFDSINIQNVSYTVTNLKQSRTALIATNLDLKPEGTTWDNV